MDVQGVVRMTGVKKPEVGGGRARERVPHARRQHPGWPSTKPALERHHPASRASDALTAAAVHCISITTTPSLCICIAHPFS